MAGRHSPSLPGRQTAASAGNLVSRAAGKIVRMASSANGRWLRRQGRSATAGKIADVAGYVSAQTIFREDVRRKSAARRCDGDVSSPE